jgi:hypothetical protein
MKTLQVLVNAGFNLNTANEINIKLTESLDISMSNDDSLDCFMIQLRDSNNNDTLITCAQVNLVTPENKTFDSYAKYSMTPQSKASFFSDIGMTITSAKEEQDFIHSSHTIALELLEEFQAIEKELVINHKNAVVEIEAKQKAESEVYKAKQTAKMEALQEAYPAIGEDMAKKIMVDMEAMTEATEEPKSITFKFLSASCYPISKVVECELIDGKVVWKIHRNPKVKDIKTQGEILVLLAKSRDI